MVTEQETPGYAPPPQPRSGGARNALLLGLAAFVAGIGATAYAVHSWRPAADLLTNTQPIIVPPAPQEATPQQPQPAMQAVPSLPAVDPMAEIAIAQAIHASAIWQVRTPPQRHDGFRSRLTHQAHATSVTKVRRCGDYATGGEFLHTVSPHAAGSLIRPYRGAGGSGSRCSTTHTCECAHQPSGKFLDGFLGKELEHHP